ncbi:ABC-type bacteriocin/lantibiotic exporter with double-glycine peptidase domain [Rathayibacter sp. PhB151]|uniref:ABC transporter ATP-binding protein n=1 Tax=Rathayibacter sp. PhB151 TaxID=2485189 RepID=UPI00106334A4|nr:ABC transporter ATP-binding protein [Rathayibacter sp. PhB151]TDX81151.1 ABC-type bacteriocin/lantibiotic exporter with double-glycine peptidase domain [Rathayibacter sp. PhB151]
MRGSIRQGLGTLLALAGAASPGWLVVAVAGSIVLAVLDTLGVAAMVPLMALLTGADTGAGSVTSTIAGLVGTSDVATLVPLVAGFVAAVFVLKSIGTIVFRWWLLGRTTRIAADASTELLRRYVLAPFAVHRTRRLSEVYRNINDSTAQASGVLLGVLGVASDLLVLVALVAVLVVASPGATLFAAVFFALLLGGTQRLLRRRQGRIGEETAEASLQTWQFLLPSLDGFREARLSSSASSLVAGFQAAKRRGAQASRMLSLVSELPKYLLEIGFVVAIIGVSGILVATGSSAEALSVLGVFAAASLRALPTLNRISATFAIVRSGQASLRIVDDAARELDAHGSHDETPGPGGRFAGDIELERVVYRYPDASRDVLRGVTLRLAENATTAFVGSSGAGKSTLLDLVLGLLEPTEGRVLCGGRPIQEDLAGWYAGLGVVPQDVFLLDDSFAANIAFGVPRDGVDPERIREVVRIAQLEDFVEQLPLGLDTRVGERGVRLSGGQRQRIGLARALYRRPSVLVLDEATSALDNRTEHEISTAIAALHGSMTVLIVAHRLSTVRGADRLLFLEDGRIEGEGTFEEVRAAHPGFAQLVALGELS